MNIYLNKPNTKIFEVGVGNIHQSNVFQYMLQRKPILIEKILNGFGSTFIKYETIAKIFYPDTSKLICFEPNPLMYKYLAQESFGINNITIHNVAIGDENQLEKLILAGNNSYLEKFHSPVNAVFENRAHEIFSYDLVNCYTIDKFDKNDIDVLFLAMEGAEYQLLKNLKSRPSLIWFKNHHYNDYKYLIKNLRGIYDFLKNNQYRPLIIDDMNSFHIKTGSLENNDIIVDGLVEELNNLCYP